MKEPGNSQVSTADPGRKRKKRKGGTSFSNSKQRRRRELRKKEQTCTQGSEPPTDLSKTGGEDEIGTYSRNEELERIEEEREHSESREPSMGESEQRSNSDTSGSEETKEDTISNVSMGLGFDARGSDIHFGYMENDMLKLRYVM